MLKFYNWLMKAGEPALIRILDKRVRAGKEDPERLNERKGQPSLERPEGTLYWLHAASVGEVQSSQILIKELLQNNKDLHILVTTGTLTSAKMMAKNLPERAFHQFYPLDNPKWCQSFLQHWKPNLVFWMESELWPNMLKAIRQDNIPAFLINARLSPASYRKWSLLKPSITKLLGTFSLILCQTDDDQAYYRKLGAKNVHITDNLKYSASPLSFDKEELERFTTPLLQRPFWLYASTHKGEEEIAARIHQQLKLQFPEILAIITPRHPERRDQIKETLSSAGLNTVFRGEKRTLPAGDTDIYLVDTLGELGLFYRAAPIAVIGRSLSDDGGGGHNPIEAAQLHCAVLHGPNIQNLQEIFDEMDGENAAIRVENETDLFEKLQMLLNNEAELNKIQEKAFTFAKNKNKVLERVMTHLRPYIENAS